MKGASGPRIGILGGTFNPVHNGHLLLAQSAIEAFDLCRILFVPCAFPPHKSTTELADAGHRVAMLQEAIEDDLRFEICDVELRRGGTSYAVDTLLELRELFPGAALHFIIGTDTLPELHLWKDAGRLLTLCTFVAFARPGCGPDVVLEKDIRLDPPWPQRLLENVQSSRRVDISSSEIRYRVAEGMSIRYLVPRGVEMYIAEHSLYGSSREQ